MNALSRAACPCGMPRFLADGTLYLSKRWHRMHLEHHLIAYPNLDRTSRWNLERLIDEATEDQ